MSFLKTNDIGRTGTTKIAILLGICSVCLTPLLAQDQSSDRDRLTRLEPGTMIPVRVNEMIDVKRSDISGVALLTSKITRVYRGTVDQDVRGQNGLTAIPKGSQVELMVRVARDNGLLLDLDSVVANGQRYAVKGDPAPTADDVTVGEIMGGIDKLGGQVVDVPLNAVITFRLKKALQVGVADRGSDRDGIHYH